MWGGAKIISGSTIIVSSEMELSGKDFRYANCLGQVVVTDNERGIILRSESLFYDRIDEISRVDGYIEMQDLKNEVVVKGGYFEYFGKEEIAIIQIGVRILKVSEESDLACRSEMARYRRDDEILELSGMPRVTRNDDKYQAARIIIDLDTDEITLEGNVKGSVTEESEETEEPQIEEPAPLDPEAIPEGRTISEPAVLEEAADE